MSDLFFSDVGGFRVLIKTQSNFREQYTCDFMFKYYENTFLSTHARCVLFGIGNGTGGTGMLIILERYNSEDYISVLNNGGAGWDYIRDGSNDPIKINTTSTTKYYHVCFNFVEIDANSFTYELNLIEGPTYSPVPTTVSGTSTVGASFNPQVAFGSPNQDIATNRLPDIDLVVGVDTIFGYVSTNITMNFLRLWNGSINGTTNAYKPIDLYNLNMIPEHVPINIGVPYPVDFGTGGDIQELMFQLNSKDASTLAELENSSEKSVSEPDGELVTLTNSSTGYPPLSDFGLNDTEGLISLESNTLTSGDPHVYPFFGDKYNIIGSGTFNYFDYKNKVNENYLTINCYIVMTKPNRKKQYFNDIVYIREKCGKYEYKTEINFNDMSIQNKQDFMHVYETDTTIRKPDRSIEVPKHYSCYIYALNENIKITLSTHDKSINVRCGNHIKHMCGGGLVSKDKLIQVSKRKLIEKYKQKYMPAIKEQFLVKSQKNIDNLEYNSDKLIEKNNTYDKIIENNFDKIIREKFYEIIENNFNEMIKVNFDEIIDKY